MSLSVNAREIKQNSSKWKSSLWQRKRCVSSSHYVRLKKFSHVYPLWAVRLHFNKSRKFKWATEETETKRALARSPREFKVSQRIRIHERQLRKIIEILRKVFYSPTLLLLAESNKIIYLFGCSKCSGEIRMLSNVYMQSVLKAHVQTGTVILFALFT